MMGATQQCTVLNLRDASAMRRLVIVADNSLIVQAIRIGFHKSGEFKLIGTANARTTSARTVLGPAPDAILFDDMERSERALELLAEIRAEDENVPVLMLSIHLDPDWLDRLFRAGANGVISKATHPAALATLVRETLNGHIVHRPPAAARHPQSSRGPVIAGENLPLTPREVEILQLVASGSTNGYIARHLWVTEQTVKFHLRNIFRKLGVANRTQASHFAHVNGLVGEVSSLADEAASRRVRQLTVA